MKTELAQRRGDTPLHNFVRRQEKERINHAIQTGANPDQPNRDGHTPLSLAVETGDQSLIDVILNHPNYKPTVNIRIAILEAAMKQDLGSLLKVLGKAEAKGLFENYKDELVNKSSPSALHFAVKHRDLEMTKILLLYGADPDQPNATNQTPLQFALMDENFVPRIVANLLFYSIRKKGKNNLTSLLVEAVYDLSVNDNSKLAILQSLFSKEVQEDYSFSFVFEDFDDIMKKADDDKKFFLASLLHITISISMENYIKRFVRIMKNK